MATPKQIGGVSQLHVNPSLEPELPRLEDGEVSSLSFPKDTFVLDPKENKTLKRIADRRIALTRIVLLEPRYLEALIERNKIDQEILSFGKDLNSEQIEYLKREILRDEAMVTALKVDRQSKVLDDIANKLQKAHSLSVKEKKGLLDRHLNLATHYTLFNSIPMTSEEDDLFVHEKLAVLTDKVFEMIFEFVDHDFSPQIRNLKYLYQAYQLLQKGQTDEAMDFLEGIQNAFPEARTMFSKLVQDRHKAIALGALDAWDFYNQEVLAAEMEKVGSIRGLIFGINGEQIQATGYLRKKFIDAMRKVVKAGMANTLSEALVYVKDNAQDSSIAALAGHHWRGISNPPFVQALIYFSDQLRQGDWYSERVIEKAFIFESTEDAVLAPAAAYHLVASFSNNPKIQQKARENIEALQGKSSYGRAVAKFVRSIDPVDVTVQVLFMFMSAGLGNMAKTATLLKLAKGTRYNYKLILGGASAAGFLTDGTSLWALTQLSRTWNHDVAQTFNITHLAKSYAATVMMVGLTRVFALEGNVAGLQAVKKFGGGKVLLWGTTHAAGLGGMVASTRLSQALGLQEGAPGGAAEDNIHDLLTYVEFALAHKMADFVTSGKLGEATKRQKKKLEDLVRRLKENTLPLPLQEEVWALTDEVSDRSEKEKFEVNDFPTSDRSGGLFWWQSIQYGPGLQRVSDDNFYRGYIMAVPQDIPKIVRLMMKLGKSRANTGKTTYFKWLLGAPEVSPKREYLAMYGLVGDYKGLPKNLCSVAIYGDAIQEIKDILGALSRKSQWKDIEQNRLSNMNGQAPRRPGTNAYIDDGGKEWRSLGWNNQPGYSENEARDPDWRKKKEGAPTIQFAARKIKTAALPRPVSRPIVHPEIAGIPIDHPLVQRIEVHSQRPDQLKDAMGDIHSVRDIGFTIFDHQGRVIGNVALTERLSGKVKELYLFAIYIPPLGSPPNLANEIKGKGIGSAVMASLLKLIQGNHYDVITTAATEDGLTAWTSGVYRFRFGSLNRDPESKVPLSGEIMPQGGHPTLIRESVDNLSETVQEEFNQWLKTPEGNTFLESPTGDRYLASLSQRGVSPNQIGNHPELYPNEFKKTLKGLDLVRDLRADPIRNEEIEQLAEHAARKTP